MRSAHAHSAAISDIFIYPIYAEYGFELTIGNERGMKHYNICRKAVHPP